MKRLLGFVLVVAVVGVALLGSAAPARAESPSIEAQYCAWLYHQRPYAAVNGRWKLEQYDVLPCARVERIEWVIGTDTRGRDYVSVESNSLAQWAAKLGK